MKLYDTWNEIRNDCGEYKELITFAAQAIGMSPKEIRDECIENRRLRVENERLLREVKKLHAYKDWANWQCGYCHVAIDYKNASPDKSRCFGCWLERK